MTDFEMLRQTRDALANLVEDPNAEHGFGATVGDRGVDLNTGMAEFEMHLPDGTSYEVQIRETT